MLTIVHDPVYLSTDFITSSQFKREPDDAQLESLALPNGAAIWLRRGLDDEATCRCCCSLALAGSSAFAQVDFAGEWDHPGVFGQEDFNDRGQGPEIGDYLGLPLNEAGMRKAESYSGSWLSVPEHQCTPHPAAYQTWGPNTLIVNKEYDRGPPRRPRRSGSTAPSASIASSGWTAGRIRPRGAAYVSTGSRPATGKATR